MAVINGNFDQNLSENFASIREYNYDHRFQNNVYYKEKGFTFEDVLTLNNYDGGYYDLNFGGNSIAYKRASNGDPIISGGNFTGFKTSYWSGSSWVERFAATGFKYSAKSFYQAVMSSTRADDVKAMQTILNGNDTFELSSQRDVVRAYSGNDKIFGRGGNDLLNGGLGNDLIIGGGGKDKLVGGGGKDTLVGGGGVDKFIYRTVGDSRIGKNRRDVITDFKGSQGEKIRLSAIDAFTKTRGNQAFTYIGSKAFTGTKGEVRFSGGILQMNTGTDKAADMEIALTGVTSFSQNFLIL